MTAKAKSHSASAATSKDQHATTSTELSTTLPSFYTHDIAVPNRSDQNQALGATFNHSVVFMQLVGTTSRFGNYEVYVMTRFSQGSGDTYGVQVKKVYLRLGNLMAGYNLSPWMDPGAAVPVVDDQGPPAQPSPTAHRCATPQNSDATGERHSPLRYPRPQ